jgi:hypothetical protein
MLEYQNNNGKVGAKILAEQIMFNRSKMNELMARFGFNTERLSDYELVSLMGDLSLRNKQFVPTLATYINSSPNTSTSGIRTSKSRCRSRKSRIGKGFRKRKNVDFDWRFSSCCNWCCGRSYPLS